MALLTVGAVLVFFALFVKNFGNHIFVKKNGPERLSGSSQTYLFSSIYNIDQATVVIRHFKNMRFFC